MEQWWLLIVGALLAGPVWIALSYWSAGRVWRSAKRMSRRARGREHLAELGQLAGGLAHEIKNPLSTINVNLKLLSEDLQRYEDDEHRRWAHRLQSVQAEADRLKDILNDFLRFAGKVELQLENVNLCRLIEELTDFFAPQTEAAKILMRAYLPDEPIHCSLDANLIKQALLNLMINATQAMSAGGELFIKVSTNRNEAIVEVTDTGDGIGPDELGRIFEVYYSTKHHGTGLGLPVSKKIIEEHGGRLEIESVLDQGTTFTIVLPINSPQ